MRILKSILKWGLSLLIATVLAVGLWLYFAPPALIRVASNYAAKIVCSNVFIAGRAAGEVLAVDVQAPGHPIFRIMRVGVDGEDATVRAGLFGPFGKGFAVFEGGTGCAVSPDGETPPAGDVALGFPEERNTGSAQWPDGLAIDASQDPAIVSILDDPAMTGPGMRAVAVVKNGRIVGERYGEDVPHIDQPLIGWSMTKTVTAAIVGTLVREGRLSPDQKNLLPEWQGDGRAEITVADLMGMASGLEFNEEYGDVTDVTRMLYLEPDMAGFAAGKPLVAVPGEDFSYSSGSTVILSRIWQNAFDNEVEALRWPREALFSPLGMDSAVLETDFSGTFVGSSYLYASARDWARFGQFLMQRGEWKGRQLLPEGWVEWMWTPTEVSDGEYGHSIWSHGPRVTTPEDQHQDAGFDLPDDAYWLLGHDGQTMTIIPSRDLVILRMGLTPTKLGYKPQKLVEALVKAFDATAQEVE